MDQEYDEVEFECKGDELALRQASDTPPPPDPQDDPYVTDITPAVEPKMMPIRYSMYDGWSPEQIEAKLQGEAARDIAFDANSHYENQIEGLENMICHMDFWPQAVDVFKQRQTELALQIDYTARGTKHDRRGLQAILKECHAEITQKRPR